MSRTFHHNDAKGGKLLKLPDRYTGWIGEGCWRQMGRKFIKKMRHRAWRRLSFTVE